MPTILNGWHPGEKAIQRKLNYDGTMSEAWTWVESGMSEEHRQFHTTRLPFIPLTTLDAEGRPWGSLATGADGKIGFVTSPKYTDLDMDLLIAGGDPLSDNLKLFKNDSYFLIAGIGIEFTTRRRNKFAGWIKEVVWKNSNNVHISLQVNQAIGNCPKYINVRDLIPHKEIDPSVVHREPILSSEDRLPDEAVSFIQSADTVFIGTSYHASKEYEDKFPSHVGMNQRGGRPGFVRVRPSDNRTVVLPDYSGNRLMTSLGNIEATGLASLTFTSFTTGDVLYLTGKARTLVGPEAEKIMPRQKVLTTLYTTGYIFVRDSLSTRQRHGTTPERSPYSPPVLYLAEEKPSEIIFDDIFVCLKSVQLHSSTLATFNFEASQPIHIRAGQTAILDFTNLLGERQYQHMAPGEETSVNDDRIRTWTVSSTHPNPGGTSNFSLTMREKPGGLVTGTLFSIVRRLLEMRPELLEDTTSLGLEVRLIGIGGNFTLHSDGFKLLWIAGGIGVTPFLSMLRWLSQLPANKDYDVMLILSSREPQILLPMIINAYGFSSFPLKLHIFTDQPTPEYSLPSMFTIKFFAGRVGSDFFTKNLSEIGDRYTYLCGPPSFEQNVISNLVDVGFNEKQITRESFTY